MKRKMKKTPKIIGFILLIVIVGVFIYPNYTKKEEPKEEEVIVEEPKEKVYNLSLIMVGDALIHSSVYNDAYDSSTKLYDFKKQVSLIKPIVEKYDLAFYNQETILGGVELGLSSYPQFNSPQEVGDAMIDAGFNIVGLANNHTLDKYEKGITKSLEYWNSIKDILTAGSYLSFEDRNTPRIKTKNNISYTMLSYTYGTNGLPVPSGKEYLVNLWNVYSNTEYEAYKEQVRLDIEAVRDKVDILIVAMHWGVEYTFTPNTFQNDMANYLASLGVDIIIGHHPHVIQPVTWINNTLVFYSLGNFISAQLQDQNFNKMIGLMSNLDIVKTVKGDETTIKIENIENELIYTYYSNWRNFKVIPFSQMTEEYNRNYIKLYETYSEIVKKLDPTQVVKPLD
jgi:poly-gamma-glutamate synthesis protein (capsule biosynthesis protein)